MWRRCAPLAAPGRCRCASALHSDAGASFDAEVAIDVEHRDTCVDLALSGPDRAVGRILGRLEVAAWAESLAISLAPATVRLSDAGAADSARGSAASSADPVADASLPRQ